MLPSLPEILALKTSALALIKTEEVTSSKSTSLMKTCSKLHSIPKISNLKDSSLALTKSEATKISEQPSTVVFDVSPTVSST